MAGARHPQFARVTIRKYPFCPAELNNDLASRNTVQSSQCQQQNPQQKQLASKPLFGPWSVNTNRNNARVHGEENTVLQEEEKMMDMAKESKGSPLGGRYLSSAEDAAMEEVLCVLPMSLSVSPQQTHPF